MSADVPDWNAAAERVEDLIAYLAPRHEEARSAAPVGRVAHASGCRQRAEDAALADPEFTLDVVEAQFSSAATTSRKQRRARRGGGDDV